MGSATRTLPILRQVVNSLSVNSKRCYSVYSRIATTPSLTSHLLRCQGPNFTTRDLFPMASSNGILPRLLSTNGSGEKKVEVPPKVQSTMEAEPEPKLSLFQKFKKMYKEYWYVLIPVHGVTSCFWFGSFYYLAVSGVDIVPLLEYVGASEGIIKTIGNTGAGYIAVAYGMYKIATPARYTVTLGGTTITINYLRKWGYIKPIPSREKMTEMFKEKGKELKSRRAKVLAKMNLRRKGSNSSQNKQS